MKNLEEKIWDYIDGIATQQERIDLEVFLQNNPPAQEKFNELNANNLEFKCLELEQPSYAFSANVMNQISVPLSKNAMVDKRIIYLIGSLFVSGIIACLVYVMINTNWQSNSSFKQINLFENISFSNFSLSFTKQYQYLFYGFLIFDLAVLLKFIDSHFNKHKAYY